MAPPQSLPHPVAAVVALAGETTSPAAAPDSDAAAGWASLVWITAIVVLVVLVTAAGMAYLRRTAPRRAPGGDRADHGPGVPQSQGEPDRPW